MSIEEVDQGSSRLEEALRGVDEGTSGDRRPSDEALLEELEGQLDPTTRLLFQHLSRQRAEQEDELEQERRNRRQERARRAARVQRLIRDLRDEIEDLKAAQEDLAAALGACGACLGSEPECDECEGQGRPGTSAPDPVLFEALVVPAVRRHRREIGPGRVRASSSPRRLHPTEVGRDTVIAQQEN